MVRYALYIAGGLVATGLCVIAGFEILTITHVEPVLESHQSIQKQFVEKYLEDLALVRELPLQEKGGTRDAASRLNSHLPWWPRNSQPSTSIQVPPALREKLLRTRGSWIKKHRYFKDAPIDLSFFNDLQSFDVWDLEKSEPIANLIAKRRYVFPHEIPTIDTVDLLTLVKLRLIKAVADKDPATALRQVRSLAQLLFTTENLSQQLTALSILKLERAAVRYYVEKKLMREEDWKLADKDLVRRAARAIWATRGYLRLWTPQDILEKVFLGEQIPLGFCAALNEAIPVERAYLPQLHTYWPLERDFSDSYRTLDRIVSRGRQTCRLTYLGSMLDNGERPASGAPVPWVLGQLPYSRRLFGLKMNSLLLHGFDNYRGKRSD